MHNSGVSSTTLPNQVGLNGWIKTYGSAHATGMDPRKHCSKYYVKYDSSKGAFTGSIPFNILIDATTMKILEKGTPYKSLPSSFAKYLP